eukprot:scaffold2552_cov380-Prasinococcus_capsulatus_cf.AAC.24
MPWASNTRRSARAGHDDGAPPRRHSWRTQPSLPLREGRRSGDPATLTAPCAQGPQRDVLARSVVSLATARVSELAPNPSLPGHSPHPLLASPHRARRQYFSRLPAHPFYGYASPGASLVPVTLAKRRWIRLAARACDSWLAKLAQGSLTNHFLPAYEAYNLSGDALCDSQYRFEHIRSASGCGASQGRLGTSNIGCTARPRARRGLESRK